MTAAAVAVAGNNRVSNDVEQAAKRCISDVGGHVGVI